MADDKTRLGITLVLCMFKVVYSVTDPNDMKILNDFRNGLDNPEVLEWPSKGNDACGPPKWPYVYCSGDRITQLQVKDLNLRGKLPPNFNQLSMLSNLGLQRNRFYGALPSFSGLSNLQYAYLDYNDFDTIPSDFFDGLSSLQVLALDYNPSLNKSTGWQIPVELAKSVQLTNLSLMNCNLVGPVPEFLGELPSLTVLKLSYNRLSGVIPASFGQSLMQILWLNDQEDSGLGGTIDVIASMVSLTQLWLHGNQFTGTIPKNIGDLSSLRDLDLNGNKLVGLIPESWAAMELDRLDLNNNLLMGPIPKFKSSNVSYVSNYFCATDPGIQCAPEVNALLDFLSEVNYPANLVTQWSGNSPCEGPWLGLSCNSKSSVSIINLPRHNLTGSLSPGIAQLQSLVNIMLGGNNISGKIPENYTGLQSLKLMDLKDNNFEPPLPKFRNSVKIVIDGNPLFAVTNKTTPVSPIPTPGTGSDSPPTPTPTPPNSTSSSGSPRKTPDSSGFTGSNSTVSPVSSEPQSKSNIRYKWIVLAAIVIPVLVLLVIILSIYCCKKRRSTSKALPSVVVHPRDTSDPNNRFKIAVSDNATMSMFTRSGTSSRSGISIGTENSHAIEAGNITISVQVLRKVTDNFAPENELGRGGFGTVYKGEMYDGTKIAVKRMEAGAICNKALDEFQSEIAVLSKVRHRNLVSLMGYSTEGNERLLVYEYVPMGALSRHLFRWKENKLEPLSWRKRFTIALDVARGMEYLHSLARHTFIHRDLKSSNILLTDDFRAKVSDFGLVKLAPDGERSVATRLAGTFGYLAPEYAVMGKITTKVDVFSYGVVLIELLTGLVALDEDRSEESRYLAEWFWRIKSDKEKLVDALDSSIETNEETFESVSVLVELAGHCTAREPQHRPDMGHVVNVLVPLVEKWKPMADESDCDSGIDYSLPLPEMLKVWQETESKETSNSTLDDSQGSIPAKPSGFAESFTSADAR